MTLEQVYKDASFDLKNGGLDTFSLQAYLRDAFVAGFNASIDKSAETIKKHHDEDVVDPKIILDLKIK